jgi:hypothetical protein
MLVYLFSAFSTPLDCVKIKIFRGFLGFVGFTLDGQPTSPANFAHGQRCSPRTEETPLKYLVAI